MRYTQPPNNYNNNKQRRYRLSNTEIINHLFHYNLLIIIPIIYCVILLYISFNL